MQNKITPKTVEQQLVAIYESSLNKESKWYQEDLANYKSNIARITPEEQQHLLNNIKALNSKVFENFVNREVNKMDKAGMYSKPLSK